MQHTENRAGRIARNAELATDCGMVLPTMLGGKGGR